MTETVRHDLMRSTNMLSVFNCIRKHGPISKRRIQEETGLSWGAVSTFSADLLERGIISETGRVDTGSRRSATAFDINLENNLIIGIDTNVIGMTGVIIDLKSRVTPAATPRTPPAGPVLLPVGGNQREGGMGMIRFRRGLSRAG